MKILWLYKYIASYNFDKWFHLELVRHMRELGYNIVAYGPDLEIEYADLIELSYDSELEWNDLIKELSIDVAILNTRSRAFDYYSPFTGEKSGCWLPRGFSSSNIIPKVIIDEDSHYEKNDNWLVENGFCLCFQRHYSQAARKWKVRTEWLPFSVNENVFHPDSKLERTNKICFVGSATDKYTDRIYAVQRLEKLVDSYHRKDGNDYVECLRSYVSCLSSGSDYDICAAKNFEIMASGTVLFTNSFSGLHELFPPDTYCMWNRNNVVERAEDIIGSPKYAEVVAQAGLLHILKNHTDAIRTAQLVNRLEELC